MCEKLISIKAAHCSPASEFILLRVAPLLQIGIDFFSKNIFHIQHDPTHFLNTSSVGQDLNILRQVERERRRMARGQRGQFSPDPALLRAYQGVRLDRSNSPLLQGRTIDPSAPPKEYYSFEDARKEFHRVQTGQAEKGLVEEELNLVTDPSVDLLHTEHSGHHFFTVYATPEKGVGEDGAKLRPRNFIHVLPPPHHTKGILFMCPAENSSVWCVSYICGELWAEDG